MTTTLIEVTVKITYEINGEVKDYGFESIEQVKDMEDLSVLEDGATTKITKFVSIREMDESELVDDEENDFQYL